MDEEPKADNVLWNSQVPLTPQAETRDSYGDAQQSDGDIFPFERPEGALGSYYEDALPYYDDPDLFSYEALGSYRDAEQSSGAIDPYTQQPDSVLYSFGDVQSLPPLEALDSYGGFHAQDSGQYTGNIGAYQADLDMVPSRSAENTVQRFVVLLSTDHERMHTAIENGSQVLLYKLFLVTEVVENGVALLAAGNDTLGYITGLEDIEGADDLIDIPEFLGREKVVPFYCQKDLSPDLTSVGLENGTPGLKKIGLLYNPPFTAPLFIANKDLAPQCIRQNPVEKHLWQLNDPVLLTGIVHWNIHCPPFTYSGIITVPPPTPVHAGGNPGKRPLGLSSSPEALGSRKLLKLRTSVPAVPLQWEDPEPSTVPSFPELNFTWAPGGFDDDGQYLGYVPDETPAEPEDRVQASGDGNQAPEDGDDVEMLDEEDQSSEDKDADADTVISSELSELLYHVALGPEHIKIVRHMLLLFRLFAVEDGHNIGILFGDSMEMSKLVKLLYNMATEKFDVSYEYEKQGIIRTVMALLTSDIGSLRTYRNAIAIGPTAKSGYGLPAYKHATGQSMLAARRLLKKGAYLYDGGANHAPDAVRYGHPGIRQLALHITDRVIPPSRHPYERARENLAVYFNKPELATAIPRKAIVLAAHLFWGSHCLSAGMSRREIADRYCAQFAIIQADVYLPENIASFERIAQEWRFDPLPLAKKSTRRRTGRRS